MTVSMITNFFNNLRIKTTTKIDSKIIQRNIIKIKIKQIHENICFTCAKISLELFAVMLKCSSQAAWKLPIVFLKATVNLS